MGKLVNQSGAIHTLPLLLIIAAVGIISFLLISSTLPLNGSLGSLFTKPSSHAATDTTVNGAQKAQVIDGFGTNAIPKSWNNGGIKPAIDALVANGNTMWRVDVGNGHSTWETTNDDSNPSTFNWTAYNAIYTNPQFTDLWSELHYLNSKGINNIELSMSGLVPNWMSSSNDGMNIKSGMEDEFVEEVVSMLYYARNTEGIQFHRVSPLNETDGGPPEGPNIPTTAQFVSILHKLAVRLDALGMSDVKIIAPHYVGRIDYVGAMLNDSVVMNHTEAMAFHDYVGSSLGGNLQQIQFSNFPNTHAWVGEWNNATTDGWLDDGHQVANEWIFAKVMTEYLMNFLDDGENAMMSWDAWDNWHEHNPCCAIDRWGEMALNSDGVTYSPKKRLYTNAQFFKFILPGMTKIGASTTKAGIRIQAYTDTTSKVTIVGENTSSSAQTLNITLNSVPAVSSFNFFQTTQTKNLNQENNVPVSSNVATVTVDPNSFFTLSNVGTTSTPSPSPSMVPSPTPSATPTFAPSPSPNPCNGADVNGNHTVDLIDYSTVISHFGQQVPKNTNGDTNGDGLVDLLDYSTVVSHFGQQGC